MSVLTVTKENFQKEILDSSRTVLLDFWATWCGPCMMVAPTVDRIAEQNDNILVGKINVDEQPELARTFGIVSIPTFIVIKDGKVSSQAVGVRSENQILEMIGK